jgi:hypothetical protein
MFRASVRIHSLHFEQNRRNENGNRSQWKLARCNYFFSISLIKKYTQMVCQLYQRGDGVTVVPIPFQHCLRHIFSIYHFRMIRWNVWNFEVWNTFRPQSSSPSTATTMYQMLICSYTSQLSIATGVKSIGSVCAKWHRFKVGQDRLVDRWGTQIFTCRYWINVHETFSHFHSKYSGDQCERIHCVLNKIGEAKIEILANKNWPGAITFFLNKNTIETVLFCHKSNQVTDHINLGQSTFTSTQCVLLHCLS